MKKGEMIDNIAKLIKKYKHFDNVRLATLILVMQGREGMLPPPETIPELLRFEARSGLYAYCKYESNNPDCLWESEDNE